MPQATPSPKDSLVLRWLALAGAAGAAGAAAAAHFSSNSLWQTLAFIAALLALAGAAGLWRAMGKRSSALAAAAQQSGEQTREVSALQEELELHRRLERELTEAKQVAEAAMMAKGEFLATMSHEIRTPLNGIIPMLDLLMSERLSPDQHDILRTAYTSAKQMQRIVDDILDYSKLEANKLQLETTGFNLRELLDSVIQLMDKSAEAKGLRLTLHVDPAVRLAVRGDPVRLRQILTNLLSNALKFTERGSVALSVTRRGETLTQHDLRFEVRDTGIGIAKENMGRLFRAFTQADTSTTRLYGGTGLGLVICKRIADLMGGSIGVDSEAGRGSTFWLEIPLLKASGDMQGLRSDLNGARALLLSTDPGMRHKFGQSAPAWGVQLTLAETTQDALTRLRSSLTRGPNWSFDLLLVDLNSIKNTAIALHRNLRRTPELEGLRVVYLFGDEPLSPELSGGPQVLALARVMGPAELRGALTNFISAPARSADVPPVPLPPSAPPISAQPPSQPMPAAAPAPVPMMTTEAYAAAIPSPTPAPAPAEPAAARPRGRLLLVEDNPVNLMVAQRLIGLLGLHCDTADNGEKALERMLAGNIDLVLMDCQMPVKDGYTATREWRQYEINHNLVRLPIIAMTANAMAGDRQKCLDAGMDDYLSKPVDRRLLESTVGRWLQPRPATPAPAPVSATPAPVRAAPVPIRIEESAASAPTEAAAPALAPAPLPTPAAPAAPAVPAAPPAPIAPVLAMDVVEELRAVMGDEYISLVRIFLEDAPTHVQRLEAAAANNDMAGLVAPAHTLKSSAANLGAMALSAAAKRIELGARAGVLPRAAVAVAVLESEFRRAQLAMQALIKG